MKDNIIALPVGRIRRDTPINRRKQDRDPELFVRMIERDTNLPERRKAKRDAYYEARKKEQEDAEWLTTLLAETTAFSLLGGTLAVALALVL